MVKIRAKLIEKPHVFQVKFTYFITKNPHVFLFWDHYTLCTIYTMNTDSNSQNFPARVMRMNFPLCFQIKLNRTFMRKSCASPACDWFGTCAWTFMQMSCARTLHAHFNRYVEWLLLNHFDNFFSGALE